MITWNKTKLKHLDFIFQTIYSINILIGTLLQNIFEQINGIAICKDEEEEKEL